MTGLLSEDGHSVLVCAPVEEGLARSQTKLWLRSALRRLFGTLTACPDGRNGSKLPPTNKTLGDELTEGAPKHTNWLRHLLPDIIKNLEASVS